MGGICLMEKCLNLNVNSLEACIQIYEYVAITKPYIEYSNIIEFFVAAFLFNNVRLYLEQNSFLFLMRLYKTSFWFGNDAMTNVCTGMI